ncbi:TonB-dependent copper receptor [Ferrimonas balearica]|uniref:TonB-dependent copper receptor n=1 Tax=Ferrimonas balearica TaxID=44012 RepID=UPI001F351122|nr:TonB-dependent copper receptor [Ferrimonas balearica]MBY6093869.1 TonB-dependent copper receptor [Ferrimonas balearica]
MPVSKLLAVTAAVNLALALPAYADKISDCAEEGHCDEYQVVTADVMQSPLTVVTDPKLPRQPLPAFDGSGFLRTIPGFNVIRKGGAGGDITLRGMAGSRVNIVNDGQQVGGTCGGRMDPPTNYISPDTYERVEVIKGPQTVKYGPVGSAGTVLFERDHFGLAEKGTEGRASMTFGSFERKDYAMELITGTPDHYWRIDANHSESDDFEDGNGDTMQSSYDRDSFHTAIGWTPDADSVLELSYGFSSGSAEYADRANKARQIDNENATLLARTGSQLDWLKMVEFQAYWNQNDHIMDQFDKPDNTAPGANPRRTNVGGHLWFELTPSDNWELLVGIDYLDSTQDMRNGLSLDELLGNAFEDVYSKENLGLLLESDWQVGPGKVVAGARYDRYEQTLLGSWSGANKVNERTENLVSGFGRYEWLLEQHQLYAGVGYAQRIADYWEIMKSGKNLTLDPEQTTQLDMGWIYQGAVELSASLFYADIQDYILIDNNSMPSARNVDATLWGGELGASYRFAQYFKLTTTVAYTHGDNDTDNVALGQISPLEGRVALDYENDNWAFGALWRLVDNQDRVAVGQGNIVGQDLGETAGFGVLSLNGAWKHGEAIRLSFGIDNLFDKAYAEHVSKAGSGNDMLPPEERTVRVNEPGRNAWVRLDYNF